MLHIGVATDPGGSDFHWNLVYHALSLDEADPDNTMFPSLERLVLSSINWMLLGAALLLGKFPKLMQIEAGKRYWDEDVPVDYEIPRATRFYQIDLPTSRFWFNEVLPNRPILVPFSEDHHLVASVIQAVQCRRKSGPVDRGI